MEDPPEINDFIRELGGTLAQEAGAAPTSGLSLPGWVGGVGGGSRHWASARVRFVLVRAQFLCTGSGVHH